MVELLVDIRLPTTVNMLRNGEVIVARRPGLPWGDREYKEFLIVLRDDPALDAQLQTMDSAGISYPYATYDAKGEMTQKSIWFLQYTTLQDPTLKDTTAIKLPVQLPEAFWLKNIIVKPPAPSLFSRIVSTVRGWIGL